MKLGRRTARLVREAAIAGFVAGNRFGPPLDGAEYPRDTQIWVAALRTARSFPALYPTLSAVARDSTELADDDQRNQAATIAALEAIRGQRG